MTLFTTHLWLHPTATTVHASVAPCHPPRTHNNNRKLLLCCRALSVAETAAVTVSLVAAAALALRKLEKKELETVTKEEEECCEACGGSGVCPCCRGEGFLLKKLTPQAAARARAKAEDVATRYTAGLAKKWSYCSECSGSRSCLKCQGKGFLPE